MNSAEKISITLTADMVRQVKDCVSAGEYASTSEVLRDALRLWARRRAEDAERLAALRERVHRSLEDPRPDLPLEEAFDRIERRHERMSAADNDEAA